MDLSLKRSIHPLDSQFTSNEIITIQQIYLASFLKLSLNIQSMENLTLPIIQESFVNHLTFDSPQPDSQHQTKLTSWTVHCPFIPGIAQTTSSEKIYQPARLVVVNHLKPFVTPLPPIDNSKVLRMCMQNTQFAFQLHDDGINMSYIFDNITHHDIQMFAPISPNINWNNLSN